MAIATKRVIFGHGPDILEVNKMKYKKSLSVEGAVAGFILVGVIVFVLIVIVPPLIGRGGAGAGDLLSKTKNCDGDEVSDYFDKCMCLSGPQSNDGCPTGEPTTGPAAEAREKECQKKCSK